MAFFLFPMKEGERSLDIFKIAGRILVENEEAISALKETSEEAKKTSKASEKIGDGFTKSGNITKKHLEEIAKKAGRTTDEVKVEAEKIARSYREAGMDAKSAMQKAFSDIENAAEGAGKETEKTGKGMISAFGKVAGAAGAVVTAVIAIGKAIIEVANSTRDYRVEMAKLETAFVTAGHSAIDATTTYETLYSVLGETDQAVEAANMLARLCDSEEQLAEMTKACIGVYATFGSSLPVEGLAEAANETAKTGTVTGQLADALNWVGLSEEDFNKKLSKCNTERERAAIITQTMVEAYGEAAQTYQENNEAITEAYLAEARLAEATAMLGESAEPVATKWKNFLANLTYGASAALDELQLKGSIYDPEYWAKKENLVVKETGNIYEAYLEVKRLRDLANQPITAETSSVRTETALAALAEAEAQYNRLSEAAQEARSQVEAMAEEEKIEKFTELSNKYVEDAGAIIDAFVKTYEGIYEQVSGWYGLFDEASSSVTTSVEQMMTAMQTQIDFNNNYSANLQALKDYGLGSLSEAFQSYGKEGAAYAEAIVKAVEDAGGATTDEGQAIIQGFSDMNEQITSSQEELSQTMALMNGEFETELRELNDNYEAAIEGLNLEAEAAEAAKFTMQGLLDGLEAQIPDIAEKMGEIASEMKGSLQSGIGTIEIPYTFVDVNNPYGNPPGFKTGLDYVPYDEFPAVLHKGEAVLTAEEATAWRAGKESASSGISSGTSSGSGSGVTVIQHITAVAQTPVELASATAAYFEQARWTL